ncbi:MAG TPA: GntR family transcriptional regulator [Acetobacteraceae bacterium]|nr:GntR family transcriptional regulator [Acetobacteraceae bacterium]
MKQQGATLVDRVVVAAIFSGRLPAGFRSGEQVLASLFGVSRTAAREALIRLIQVIPRRGTKAPR